VVKARSSEKPRVAFDFSGCHVLVTGGSSGIGLGVAAAFAAAGADVTITGRRANVSDYDADLSPFTYQRLEVSDAAQVEAVASALPALDILVNNAGANLPGGRSEYEPDVFEEAVRINLFGAFRMATACKEKLAKSALEGGASAIHVASMAAYFGIAIVPGYGAAKAGVVQLTKSLAVAWAADGIRVNAVAPGLVKSNMTAPMESHPQLAQPHLARTPLGRWGTPDDVSGAVLFLASPAARFITGQTLPVDGGYSIA
jgi:NAD(P)-dependent dehydrogenase (short-subunit alcohol dehydrogenase family)